MPERTLRTQAASTVDILHHFVGRDQQAMDALLETVRRNVPDANVRQRTNPNVSLQGKVDILRGKPPSILETWPGRNLEPYIDADVVADISPMWEAAGYTETYFDRAKDAVRFDSTYRAIPTNMQRQNNLFFNRAVVERAGVNPSSITDVAALVTALESVEDETDAAGLLVPQKRPWPSLDVWDMLVLSHGTADAYDRLFRGDDPQRDGNLVREALSSLATLASFVPDDALYDDWQAGLDRFVDGEAAFFAMGDWAGGVLKNRDGFDYGTDWGCVAFPGTTQTFQLVMDAFLMPSTATNTETTEDVLRHVGSATAIERFTRTRGALPPREDVSLDRFSPFFRDQMDAYRSARNHVDATRGLGIAPDQRVGVLTAIATFLSEGDVDATATQILTALDREK
ncbi:ABC transporter substrate-binding protein [Haloarcula marina]|uniref:ABC transporter substrate-binding protein n=1 Tax=Haloarcula marina TaxID=2961574 RepID=UPI0020B77BBE|nr:ABC transporter substrate-binding protein [Halomicroarcula marina]